MSLASEICPVPHLADYRERSQKYTEKMATFFQLQYTRADQMSTLTNADWLIRNMGKR